MPQPESGEKKSAYISRCVREVMNEGETQDQALGKCYGMWESAKKKAKATVEFGRDEIIIE